MYKLQEENTDQLNEEEATYTQLLIVWKVDSSKNFCLVSYLIEHDKSCVLYEDKLMRLVERYVPFSTQYDPIEETWLIRNNTVLMTRMNVTCKENCYKLEMTISEAGINEDTWRPWYF